MKGKHTPRIKEVMDAGEMSAANILSVTRKPPRL